MVKFNGWNRSRYFLVSRTRNGSTQQHLLAWSDLHTDWYTAGYEVVDWCYATSISDARLQLVSGDFRGKNGDPKYL